MDRRLRKRIRSAKDILGFPAKHGGVVLSPDTLLQYKDKFRPIFSNDYFEALENDASQFDPSHSRFMLTNALSVPLVSVTNLYVQPGERFYTVWLFLSAFFPVIAACMAPIGDLISFVGLLEHWQIDPATGKTIGDHSNVFALNVLSFVLGIFGNIALMMNFAGRAHYLTAQIVSIFCFVSSASCLLAAVLTANNRIIHEHLTASEGFWLAVFTIALYYCVSGILLTNLSGFKLGKYPPKFNLDEKQRSLMSQTIAFAIWQGVGTLAMARLMPGITFGASLYYCTVSMLTIGLGDIVPQTAGAKVFALFFSLVGVLLMGLIVAMLRQVFLTSASSSLFWHHMERERQEVLTKLEKTASPQLSKEEAFRMMREIQHKVHRHRKNISLLITVVVFISFWLIGALVFYFIEGWDYFNAMYFCFLCLITIGYGDFAPKTKLGRVFFVIWGITAVPLMTILISNVGDSLFNLYYRLDKFSRMFFHPSTYRAMIKYVRRLPLFKSHSHDVTTEIHDTVLPRQSEDSTADEQKSFAKTEGPEGRVEEEIELTRDISSSLEYLKSLFADFIDDPQKRYSFDEWMTGMKKLKGRDASKENFWLGEASPLSLPIKESNYLFIKLFEKVENDLKRLLQLQEEKLAEIETTVNPCSTGEGIQSEDDDTVGADVSR